MFFDALLKREEIKEMKDKELNKLLNMLFPGRKLYSHSLDWRNSMEYILKAKGRYGDVIVGWLENPCHIERW